MSLPENAGRHLAPYTRADLKAMGPDERHDAKLLDRAYGAISAMCGPVEGPKAESLVREVCGGTWFVVDRLVTAFAAATYVGWQRGSVAGHEAAVAQMADGMAETSSADLDRLAAMGGPIAEAVAEQRATRREREDLEEMFDALDAQGGGR